MKEFKEHILIILYSVLGSILIFSGIIGILLCTLSQNLFTLIISICFTICFFLAGTCFFYKFVKKILHCRKTKPDTKHIIDKQSVNTVHAVHMEHETNAPVPQIDSMASDYTNEYTVENGKDFSIAITTENLPSLKCNCDGCYKQTTCPYGHMIYDEITHERMTLSDKFIMLTACNDE